MEDIDTALRPLWRSPNERYQALFILQDLVQVTMAVNVYAQAKEDVVGNALINAKLQDRPNDALGWSRRLANIILIKVFTLLDDVEKFEAGISPPKSYKEFFLSYFSRGPPGIDDYFYCYGLLDIAAQLGRVVPNGSLPAALKRKLSAVFRNGNEPSYRWKATEVFLADPESRSAQSGFLKGEAPPGQRQEVDVIARVLSEEDGATRAQIRNSIAAGPSPWDSLTSNRLNDFRLRSEDWNEYSFPTFHLSHQAETSHVRIPLGSRLFPKRYLSAVLSPDCNSAAFLRSGSFHVCSIASFREIERTTIRSKTCPTGQDYRAVALSNQFLAVVTNTYLEVWRHSNGTEPIEPYPVESLYIVTDQDNGGWDPRCIAIYETADRVWIAVGGEASGHSGAIKVFLLNVAVQLTKLAHHDARFNSPYLLNGIPTTISFATDGSRLCCVTTSNKVLVWFLSNNMRPKHSPFKIEKVYQEVSTQ